MMPHKYLILLFLCFSLLAPVAVQAQTNDLALAQEYFRKGEYEKAASIYEKLADNMNLLPRVYPEYLQTLIHLKEYKDAEKLVKKISKRFPGIPTYDVDQGMVMLAAGNTDGAARYFDKLISKLSLPAVLPTASAFEQKGQYEYAEKTYLQGRKLSRSDTEFSRQLVQLYAYGNQTEKLIHEVLAMVRADAGQVPVVQNLLQNALKEEKEFDTLEKALISNVQKYPNEVAYNEMLVWLYTQRKDFYSALMQARSLDKRQRSGGSRVMEIGAISLKNKDYQSAIEAYDYIVKEYKGGPFYAMARQKLINAREEQVKNTFPVDKEKIRLLLADYQNYLNELGRSAQTAEVMKSMAMLYGFYLDEKDKAITMLNEVINTPRANSDLVAEAKISLGDIYLLKGEPWESTLLYSQVEKSHKETTIGHEAKLRNARLNYFKGDFELAQGHLDVLKLATSREIANDAMDLSLLITDNLGLDTTTAAMEAYAATELLIFQNKLPEAITKLDNMLTQFPGHSLTDEIFYLKANVFLKMGDYQNAITNLSAITNNPKYDILTDDALFLMAKIYEENLKDKAKAQELYNQLMVKFPASIFVVEARKRFRALRGDSVVN